MTLWDDARALVGGGEADTALDLMANFLKGRLGGPLASRARPLLDSAVLLQARGRRLTLGQMQGTMSGADAEVERARRDQALLGLITEVERMDKFRPPVVTIDLPDEPNLEKLMGSESQLRSTGWLAEGLRLGSAVCRLTDDITFGTGFRCRTDVVITNNHVIGNKAAAIKFRADFFFEEDSQRKLRVPMSVPLEPDRLFWTSAKLDVTVIGLAPIARDDVAVVPLPTDVTARIDDHVNVIQHPSGGPKQIAVTNNRVLKLHDPFIHYMTDTLPGSSGSPVFLDSWHVVAIHHAGGAAVKKNARGDVIFGNEGVLVSALLSDPDFRAMHSTMAT